MVAAVFTWWNARGLHLHIELTGSRPAAGSPMEELPEQLLRTAPPPGPLFEGDSLEIDLGIDTAGAARGPASITGVIGDRRQAFGTGVVPRAGWRHASRLHAATRGVLTARSWDITASDPLGFFRTTTRCADAEVGLIFPRFTSLASRRRTRELEASLSAPRAGSGSELFGIREYRSGDSLRRIHWRSTARHGGLVVREYEPPGARLLGICVEPHPAQRAVADQICRIAASEAWDCIRDGGRVALWAPDLEPAQVTRDLWTVLEWLARYPDHPRGDGGSPAGGEEVVMVTSVALDVPATRAWVIGDAELDLDIAIERIGTEWPL